MLQETIYFGKNGTWGEVPPLVGANLVYTKWVYTVKPNADEIIQRFKVKFVACVFSRVQGKNCQETFAPLVRMDNLRFLVAEVEKQNTECYHYNVKNAFTKSHLKEKIYLSPQKEIPLKIYMYYKSYVVSMASKKPQETGTFELNNSF